MTSRRGDAEPAYRIRPATLQDTGFLADVVLTATRPPVRTQFQGKLAQVKAEQDSRLNIAAGPRR